MGKSSRRKADKRPVGSTSKSSSAGSADQAGDAVIDDADVPVVGPREPCPCGSGRRYKACHGRAAARAQTRRVTRPFEGLAGECDLVAMSVLVPAATTELTMSDGGTVIAATLLPAAWPALHRADGELAVGLQVRGGSGDPSRDIAAALLEAKELPEGFPVVTGGTAGPGPRLQDLLDPNTKPEVTVHAGFDYWLEGGANEASDEIRESLEHANEQVVPTARLSSVDAAYWCRIGTKEHIRWVMPEPEDELLDAFARLAARDELSLGPGTKFVGSFRSHGLLAAVWDLAPGDEAADLEEPTAEFRKRLDVALAESGELSSEMRRLRTGLIGRQITLL